MQLILIICKFIELFFLFLIFTGVYQIGRNQLRMAKFLAEHRYKFYKGMREDTNN